MPMSELVTGRRQSHPPCTQLIGANEAGHEAGVSFLASTRLQANICTNRRHISAALKRTRPGALSDRVYSCPKNNAHVLLLAPQSSCTTTL